MGNNMSRFSVTDTLWVDVRPTGRTFGVFGCSPGASTLLEGGFFDRKWAEKSAAEWARNALDDLVEAAERKAGWDPNP